MRRSRPPRKPPWPRATAAKSATTLDELRAILDKFDGCALKATATRLVFADGNPQARVMFVGEAPGRDEDIEGLPFVGRSGKLLDRMLAAIGLDRTSVYIANIVPWRPPGNRTPTPQESQICLPFILRQIELADPDVMVCLGGPSAQTLLGIKEGITKTRGRWFSFDTGKREIRAMPTFHPAFLLRSPLQKRFAWRDFLAIKKALGSDVRHPRERDQLLPGPRFAGTADGKHDRRSAPRRPRPARRRASSARSASRRETTRRKSPPAPRESLSIGATLAASPSLSARK